MSAKLKIEQLREALSRERARTERFEADITDASYFESELVQQRSLNLRMQLNRTDKTDRRASDRASKKHLRAHEVAL